MSQTNPTSNDRNLPELLRAAERRINAFLFNRASPDFARIPADHDHDVDLLLCEAADTIEHFARELAKAHEALASAYQAAGVLVMPEHDKRPSDRDQTELLDLLSRWETMTKEQIEAFLPWPKEWVQQPRDLAKAKQRAYDAFREWNDVTGFVPRGISYEAEIESLLDDAVNFGWNARNGEPNSAPETAAKPTDSELYGSSELFRHIWVCPMGWIGDKMIYGPGYTLADMKPWLVKLRRLVGFEHPEGTPLEQPEKATGESHGR